MPLDCPKPSHNYGWRKTAQLSNGNCFIIVALTLRLPTSLPSSTLRTLMRLRMPVPIYWHGHISSIPTESEKHSRITTLTQNTYSRTQKFRVRRDTSCHYKLELKNFEDTKELTTICSDIPEISSSGACITTWSCQPSQQLKIQTISRPTDGPSK